AKRSRPRPLQELRTPEPRSAAAVCCSGWLGRLGRRCMGATTGDAGPQWSVMLEFDLENPAIRSDIDVVNLALTLDLQLVLDPAVFRIHLRPEYLAPGEPILDRRSDRTRKPVDLHILLEGDRSDQSRKPVD